MNCPHCGSAQIQKRGKGKGEEPGHRVYCRQCGKYATLKIDLADEAQYRKTGVEVARLAKAKRFIVTSAQNNTPLCAEFWQAIVNYAEHRGAAIVVIPTKYRNPNSPFEKDEEECWWPAEVEPYLVDNEVHAHPLLWIMGNVKVQATAVSPLVGMEPLSTNASAVFGHAQIQMRVIPTPQNDMPKILQTTGSVSVKNYSRSSRGVRAEFHHSLGAVVIEKDGAIFHMRGIVGDSSNSFIDLDTHYSAEGVKEAPPAEAVVLGDEHVLFTDPEVKAATFSGKDSIVGTLRPKVLVRHDVIDSYSISHHHRHNPVIQYAKYHSGVNSLERELLQTVEHINETTPEGTENYIVSSNHHDHIRRWLMEADPKQEPWNAVIYHELMLALLRSARIGNGGIEHVDPFAHWAAPRLTRARFLTADEDVQIAGVLVSMHGEHGPNGSRGSIVNLSKIGAKSVIGHKHTPGIEKGCYQTGTGARAKREYMRGPSSVLNSHCAILANGKRQLLHVIGGRWRA